MLHIDMNAFYCSCHAADNPEQYSGKPTAVAGSPETRHGVVVTASYEARKRGVRATMTVAEAVRACRDLILIHPNFDLYRRYSRQVFELIRQYTPQLEIFSIDECWADVTGSSQFGTAMEIATQVQSRIWTELGLPCSIGVAPNKLLAKMASDFHKPMGITALWDEDVKTMLWPLPVVQLFGIGQKTAERLERLGIATIGQLAQATPARLHRVFGKRGLDMQQAANGQDDAPIVSDPEPIKSIGHSITLAVDEGRLEELDTVLLNLSDSVGRRVRHHGRVGRTVQITIRYSNRETVTRAKTLQEPTDLTEDIFTTAKGLLRQHIRQGAKVRLLGVTLTQLQDFHPDGELERQLTLFDEVAEEAPITGLRDRLRQLTTVSDELRNKYGEDILVRGRMLKPHESAQIRNRTIRGTSLQKDNLT